MFTYLYDMPVLGKSQQLSKIKQANKSI